jgi:bifunctional non-homologous end joining protein LigD
MKPMLAGTIEPGNLTTLLQDSHWWVQQKLDGDRVLFHVKDGAVTALNRNGEIRVNLVPTKVSRQFEIPGTWVFDGELMADQTYWLFDMPVAEPHINPSHPYEYRLLVLERLFAGWGPDPCVRLLPTARTATTKAALIEATMAANGEGVIFKDISAPYRPGKRSNSMLKAKYTKTADCVVTDVRRDGRANCHVSLYDGKGRLIEVGSVATAGKPAVHVGDVVEVRYLYASEERRLYQPVLLRIRDDKWATDCTMSQLVFTSRDVVELPEPPLGLVRQRRRSRSCGVEVEVLDTAHPGSFVPNGRGRWVTLCIDHGKFECHRTLKLARMFAAQPDIWCEVCRMETLEGRVS